MEQSSVKVERVWMESRKSFEQVLNDFGQHISRPNMAEFTARWTCAHSYDEIEEIVRQTVGPSGFMEFVRFPLGIFSTHDPAVKKPRSMMRLVVGNPVVMQSMARHVAEVGSYAPVTVLVFERDGKVILRYDRLASLLAPYGNQEASRIARSLDEKIISVMKEVAEEDK